LAPVDISLNIGLNSEGRDGRVRHRVREVRPPPIQTNRSFASLIHKLGHPPRSRTQRADGTYALLPPSQIFQSWVNHLPKPFPAHTGKRLFRLLFPHEGARRRYGLKETRLAAELEAALGIQGLARWDAVGGGGAGCLGHVVQAAMAKRVSTSTYFG